MPAAALSSAPHAARRAAALPRPAPYAPRPAARRPPPRGAGPAPATWRLATCLRRSPQMLLQSLDGVMVVYASGAGGRAQGCRNLPVLEPLLRPQQEDFPLQPRQPPQTLLQPAFRLSCHRAFMGVPIGGPQLLLERDELGPFRPSRRVFQHVAPDRQQPGPELALPPKLPHRAERADERVLDQVVEICFQRARA